MKKKTIFIIFLLIGITVFLTLTRIDKQCIMFDDRCDCEMNFIQIAKALELRTNPPKCRSNLKPYIQNNYCDEYWWIDAVDPMIEKDKDGNFPQRILYCPLDKERNKYKSSYIANPKIKLMELIKLKERKNIILLVERKAFHNGRRYCLFADFEHRLIDDNEYNRLKKW